MRKMRSFFAFFTLFFVEKGKISVFSVVFPYISVVKNLCPSVPYV